jgi:hypothetical protein
MGQLRFQRRFGSLPLQAGRKYIAGSVGLLDQVLFLLGKRTSVPANLAIAQTVLLVEAARTSRRNYINVISSLPAISIVDPPIYEDPHAVHPKISPIYIPNELPRISELLP